ncbi:MAG: ribosome maturation factor RimP [Clostridia bacterium]|nr:ribosome maturation factor RimP [Clostridia bacterium]
MEKKPKKKNIAETVRELVCDAVEECGCTLWDVEYVKDAGGWNLVIYIDRPEGISLTDCEMVNDAVEPIIDEADPIEGAYCLEISSPGLERDLKNHTHIEAFLGERVQVRLYTALDGSKSFTATLESHDEDADTVTFTRENGESITLERKSVAKLSTIADF